MYESQKKNQFSNELDVNYIGEIEQIPSNNT